MTTLLILSCELARQTSGSVRRSSSNQVLYLSKIKEFSCPVHIYFTCNYKFNGHPLIFFNKNEYTNSTLMTSLVHTYLLFLINKLLIYTTLKM